MTISDSDMGSKNIVIRDIGISSGLPFLTAQKVGKAGKTFPTLFSIISKPLGCK